MAGYLKIEWWNSSDLGDVLYQTGYKNKIYLDVEVERPDYNVTIESDVNGDNREIPKFKKWEKVYKIPDMHMQEDLLDAFSFMQLHDNIEVTLQTGETITVDQLRVEHEWEEVGCLAKVTISFTEDYTITTACASNINTTCLCDESSGEFEGINQISYLSVADPSKLQLIYTVANIASKRYTATLYQFSSALNAWVQLAQPDPGSCYDNLGTVTKWIYDGTYWELSPGFISSISYAAPIATVFGWAPDGTFVTVWYDAGAGWVDAGDYIAQDLITGIEVTPGATGTIHFRLEIWNHACDYSYSATFDLVIPA